MQKNNPLSVEIRILMKTQWEENLSVLTKSATVLHRIDEKTWRSSGQPISSIRYWQALGNNSWKLNK